MHTPTNHHIPGEMGWDLSTIATSRGSLLFALDLNYTIDPKDRVFVFPAPRQVTFDFPLPSYQRGKVEVFCVDADGVHDVGFEELAGVSVRDSLSKVGIYVATMDHALRGEVSDRNRRLVEYENSFGLTCA